VQPHSKIANADTTITKPKIEDIDIFFLDLANIIFFGLFITFPFFPIRRKGSESQTMPFALLTSRSLILGGTIQPLSNILKLTEF